MNSLFDDLQSFSDEMMNPCPHCGQLRKKRTVSEVPLEQQLRVVGDEDIFEYFLHCGQCNEYSPIYGGFHEPELAVPVRLKAATPQNAPCPCGSGKKYKRCCDLT